ncbi:hypothetical protein E1180_05560 [Roseibium denhamense]|uniref:site-specific DNA-methyltransferase (adenine-specific) n=2 Tax=Roseibium denhamense TaxID=76305 RepID=A0ABY1PFJ7_9HYPH|nr:hypothetical protein [Roseibium denhamense]SMP33334.1 N-6 DNA Methylase [Roseibium denhamense]
MVRTETTNPDFEWLDHARPVGLVVARSVLSDLGLVPERQTRSDSVQAAEFINIDEDGAALSDPWGFFETVLEWDEALVSGAPGGPELPASARSDLRELQTELEATWAITDRKNPEDLTLLVRIEDPGVDLDKRGALEGWEATPHQRFERLLRETSAERGVLIGDDELRLVYAPRGETSGWIIWPLRELTSVAGRVLLGGLKLMLGRSRLFVGRAEQRLPALLKKSRDEQASVSIALSEQVLGALHEMLRGLYQSDRELFGDLAANRPQHLYEGILTVLMRLVFVLYAEDRDLLPSQTDARSRAIYDEGYSARGLHDRLLEDKALHPDTMNERVGAWGRLLALFRLIHAGDPSGWVKGRGGELFDPDRFPFLEARKAVSDAPKVLRVSDSCILSILDGLRMLKGERLSYRTLDVEQIGSVYETVMGFTVEKLRNPALAIKAGKNNKVPVFIDLEELLKTAPGKRAKYLKDNADRTSLGSATEKALKAAKTQEDLAAALDGIVDERASPGRHVAPAETPVLQPTDERRGTGSHYTPRSLTEPIVRQALEPIFDRIGEDAKPDNILEIKICDPAMGSGAFLVEACRAMAARLTKAWERWPRERPKLPQDEDEDLHARRLVAQRCLYGVDKNRMATDLGRLSLWLATLARDHEFTFLNHALKTGDSLVGLTKAQIADLTWDEPGAGRPLLRKVVLEAIDKAEKGRDAIQHAPDDVTLAIQEVRNRTVEKELTAIRALGDGLLATFFGASKPKPRKEALIALQAAMTERMQPDWDKAAQLQTELRTQGGHPLQPFHWELEFPEVFDRENPGFDAMVGNPPFLGGRSISTRNGASYIAWLKHGRDDVDGGADLVAHFFRRAYSLLRQKGAMGLIASNTIAQGDTRETGLRTIIANRGSLYRATSRLKWPGDAAVVVSTVHIGKVLPDNELPTILLDERPVDRISAFLVPGLNDESPARLSQNENLAFQGSIILGMGFTFDDKAAEKGTASSLSDMERILEDPHNAERIKPYLGGEEINNDPRHWHHRYVIDFEDFPLCRDKELQLWSDSSEDDRTLMLRKGVVPRDYNRPVAADWPKLLDIVERYVKPDREKSKNKDVRAYPWWRHWRPRPELTEAMVGKDTGFALSRVSPHLELGPVPSSTTFADSCVVFAVEPVLYLAVLQSRIHETWARFFSSSMKDDLRYAPSDCFATFPFPLDYVTNAELEDIGRRYLDHRAQLMAAADEGMTPTYNKFHDPYCQAPAIVELRRLHAEMDQAVLEAYGWEDLATEAEPVFLTEETENEFTYQARLFWPSAFRDEVLARLIDLNKVRAAEETAGAGHAAAMLDKPVAPKRRGKGRRIDMDLGGERQMDFTLGDD